jgi:AbrB family looped-hinge helix DNA binding protein
MLSMSTARARLDRAGRILIPAKLRAELSVRPGDPVVLETKGDELRVRPYREAIREAQAIIRQYIPDAERSLVDELIAERRNEAKRE